jgi:CheY-like chemotaxis protein
VAMISTTCLRCGARRYPPELVLSDLHLSGLDGFACAEALRADEATRAVPFVFVTAETGVAERTRAYALVVAGFVAKRVEPATLVAFLSGAIERTAVA